jgi:hypothetical protein
MPELEFGDTDEQAIVVLKGFAHRVNNDLYNHGRDGLLTRFNLFFAQHQEREDTLDKQQQKRHLENSDKLEELKAKMDQKDLFWKIAAVMVAIAALAVTIFMAVAASKLPHGQIDPAHIFHSKIFNPMLSFMRNPPQEAGSSIAVHY